MGPLALFDKSFLQSLSVDESVWFDHFFAPVVPPFFFVETLGDLHKASTAKRTPEQEVRIIADKFPDVHGTPCAFHVSIALGNLEGHSVSMIGQVPMTSGRHVKRGGKRAVVWEESAEAKAFRRWQQGKFLDVERDFARQWRQALNDLPLSTIDEALRSVGIGIQSARNLAEAKSIADATIAHKGNSARLIAFTLRLLGASGKDRASVLWRWTSVGWPSIAAYAPYAAFVLDVELFFQVAVSSGIISSARPSNRIDVAYLHYLPFCMVFVSSDRLHAKCAPLFLRSDQEFVWGEDLKKDLAQINKHYALLPDAVKAKGLYAFADTPPKDGDFLVARLWDRHLRPWRHRPEAPPLRQLSRTDQEAQTKLIREITDIVSAPALSAKEGSFTSEEADAVVVRRLVRHKKGAWWQMPEDLKPMQNGKQS